jgi:ribosomal protein L21E
MGTLIEGNIFERPKSPVQQSNPSFTTPYYTDTINVSVLEPEHEDSRSLVRVETEYPTYEGTITASYFKQSSLYQLSANDQYNTEYDESHDRNLYISSSVKYGGPNKVFSEPTGSIIMDNRKSVYNKEYKFYYTSSLDFHNSSRYSSDKYVNFYSSKSLVETDLDPEYQFNTALNRSFYEGVKQTIATTTDGDFPVVIRLTAPTVAVPTDATDANLAVIDTE